MLMLNPLFSHVFIHHIILFIKSMSPSLDLWKTRFFKLWSHLTRLSKFGIFERETNVSRTSVLNSYFIGTPDLNRFVAGTSRYFC